jgi:hypothetical protein
MPTDNERYQNGMAILARHLHLTAVASAIVLGVILAFDFTIQPLGLVLRMYVCAGLLPWCFLLRWKRFMGVNIAGMVVAEWGLLGWLSTAGLICTDLFGTPTPTNYELGDLPVACIVLLLGVGVQVALVYYSVKNLRSYFACRVAMPEQERAPVC